MIVKRHNRNIIDGKEITVTLEDALMSIESLRFMMGGAIKRSASGKKEKVRLTEQAVVKVADTLPDLYDHLNEDYKYVAPTKFRWINMTSGERGRAEQASDFKAAVGDTVRVMWEVETEVEDAAVEIVISPNTFPGSIKAVITRNCKRQHSELLENCKRQPAAKAA